MKELTIEAKIENIDNVIEFVNVELDKFACSSKAKIEINVAIDEIFANIANYAYKSNVGDATIQVDIDDQTKVASIVFIDKGMPFDPLVKDDPNVSLSADEREIGGLGIYIVKKTMDNVEYQYKDNSNILKITKKIII